MSVSESRYVVRFFLLFIFLMIIVFTCLTWIIHLNPPTYVNLIGRPFKSIKKFFFCHLNLFWVWFIWMDKWMWIQIGTSSREALRESAASLFVSSRFYCVAAAVWIVEEENSLCLFDRSLVNFFYGLMFVIDLDHRH